MFWNSVTTWKEEYVCATLQVDVSQPEGGMGHLASVSL